MKLNLERLLNAAYKEPREELRKSILKSFKQEHKLCYNPSFLTQGYRLTGAIAIFVILAVSAPILYKINTPKYADPELMQINELIGELKDLQSGNALADLQKIDQIIVSLSN